MTLARHGKMHLFATIIVAAVCLTIAVPQAMADGTLTGNAWIEKVKGRATNYLALYEWNIYASSDGATGTGDSFRVGLPIRPQSEYEFTMPGGDYSLYLDQPLFWGRPKVVTDVTIPSSGTDYLDVELPTDYSCAFGGNSNEWGSNPWTLWKSAWYQTFMATGTSITGVDFKLAGTSADDVLITFHEDNDGDITTWPQVGVARLKENVTALGDQWIRYRSGQVPTDPGTTYAIKFTGQNGASSNDFAMFRRNEDDSGYANGQAYDLNGNAEDFDLYAIIFSDNDGTLIPYCAQVSDGGSLAGWSGAWTQQVKAMGNGLAGATLYYAGGDTWDKEFTFTIRTGSVTGQQIGPAKIGSGAYQASSNGHVAVSWNPDEVPLTPGDLYYIEIGQTNGFNPAKFTNGDNSYPDGHAFKSGSAQTDVDLHMQVVEYSDTVDIPLVYLSPALLSPVTEESSDPDDDSFTVENIGTGTVNYTITEDAGWLSVSPTTGTVTTEDDTITVSYSATGLLPGAYEATITVSDPNAPNSPQTVAVDLIVLGSTGCDALSLANPGFESGCTSWSGDCTDSSATWSPGDAQSGDKWGSVQAGGATAPMYAWQTISADALLTQLTGYMADGSHQSHDHVVQLIDGNQNGTVLAEFRRVSSPPSANGWTSIGALAGVPTSGDVTVKFGFINNTGTWSNGTATHADSLSLFQCEGGEDQPVIALSPTALSPVTDEGSNPGSDSFTVENTGGGTLDYTITDDEGWLSVTPTSGSSTGEADTITVNYTASSLDAGTYNATISVSDPDASNDSQSIGVTLTVNELPTIALSPSSLSPETDEGSSPANDSFTVQNTGGQTLDYTITDNATWLTVSPGSGTSTGEADTITVTYSTASLAVDTYNATITVSDSAASNNPQTISVSLTVNELPAITLSPTSLSPETDEGSSPANGSFTVENTGGETLSYSISDDASWLSVSPTSGSSTGEEDTITVSYSTDSLDVGTHNAIITVTDPDASNNPQMVAVTLTVNEVGAGASVAEDFESMPSWSSSYNAGWGSAASWSIVSGGESDDALRAARGSGGSSAKAMVYDIDSNTDYTISVYMKSAGSSNTYWSEVAYRLGSHSSQDFDSNPGSWTMIKKFSNTGTNGNGNNWIEYALEFDSSSNSQISVGFKHGSTGSAPDVYWDTLRIEPEDAPPPTITLSPTSLSPETNQGSSPTADTFTVENTGGGSLNYTVSDNVTWLSVSPASGSSTGEEDTITVTYATSSLSDGTHYATITVSDPNATNDSQTVSVTLTVNEFAQTVEEDFGSMPSWSSTWDSPWGSAATFSITSSGQSGNALQATRGGGGSSGRVNVYTIDANTDYTISVYISCPSSGDSYWAECAYRIGSHTAQSFDEDAGSWTMIQKFSDSGTNGNGGTWTQYSKNFNSGSDTQISVGHKLGSSGGSGPTVRWDTLRVE